MRYVHDLICANNPYGFKKKKGISSCIIIPVFLLFSLSFFVSCGGGSGGGSTAMPPETGAVSLCSSGGCTMYSSISKALAAANDGDTIYVEEGTYYESLVINKSVTIIGSEGTIIKGSSSVKSYFNKIFSGKASNANIIIELDVPGISLKRLMIEVDDNTSGISVKPGITDISNIRLDNITVTGTCTDCEEARGFSAGDTTIEKLTIVNSEFKNLTYGVYAEKLSSETTFENLTASDNSKGGIVITVVSGNVIITSCTLDKNGVGDADGAGLIVKVSAGTSVKIEGGDYNGNQTAIKIVDASGNTGSTPFIEITGNPTFSGSVAGNVDNSSSATVDVPDSVNVVHNVKPNESIQAKINDSKTKSGDTIRLGAGTYDQIIVINKPVSIIGSGSYETIITKNIPAGYVNQGVIQLEASGSETNPILFKNLLVQVKQMAGFSISSYSTKVGCNISYIKLENVKVTGNNDAAGKSERGFSVDKTSSLHYLTVNNCHFDNLTYGWYFFKEVSADSSTVDNVTVKSTTFNHNNIKGIYAEKLSDAVFTDCTASNNGFTEVSVPATEANNRLKSMTGIDINLKAGTYQNLTFDNLTVTNNGLPDLAINPNYQAGLAIKARGTGNDTFYSSYPATLTGVTVTNGIFTGNVTGIRFGKPGKNNTSPTNITVSVSNLYDNTVDLDNQLPGVTLMHTHYVKADESIQTAIDAASSGDTIILAAGTYNQVIDINKRITLLGAGSGTGGTVITKNTAIPNPAAYPLQVDGVTYSYNPVVIISASGIDSSKPVLLKNLQIRPRQDIIGAARQVPAILIRPSLDLYNVPPQIKEYVNAYVVSYVELNNVRVIGTKSDGTPESGVRVDGSTSLYHFVVKNCEFNDMGYGMIFHNSYNATDPSTVQYVEISNTIFNNNAIKGFYAEKLSDATFNSVTATNNGNPAKSPSWADANNAGIDINLKYGSYRNLKFNNLTVTGNGFADATVAPPNYGAGLAIKARGTGKDPDAVNDPKQSHPASLDKVTINGGIYTGNQVGILLGEPGKNNTSPTEISIKDANIANNNFDLSNELSLDVIVKINDGIQNTSTTTLTPSLLVYGGKTLEEKAVYYPNFQKFGFGWDWDEARPEGSADAGGAPNFGNGAFYSNVQGSEAGGPRNYSALRIYPQAIFNKNDITIGEIKSISYWTKQKDGYDTAWQLKIYTANPDAVTYPKQWYKTRLNSSIPFYANTNWNLNSTKDNLAFSSIVRKTAAGIEDNLGLLQTLGQIRDNTDYNFGSESILFIDIIAGYATDSPPVYSYLDGIVIELMNGKTAVIDLEAD